MNSRLSPSGSASKAALISGIIRFSFPMQDVEAHKNWLWTISEDALEERLAILQAEVGRYGPVAKETVNAC